MAGATVFLSDKLLESLFRTLAAYKPAGIWIGLLTTLPSDDAMTGAVEASGGNYARQQVGQADANWNAPSAGTGTARKISNVNDVTWAGVTWTGTVVGWAIYDANAAGNALFWFDSANLTVNSGDTVRFLGGNPGALVVEHD